MPFNGLVRTAQTMPCNGPKCAQLQGRMYRGLGYYDKAIKNEPKITKTVLDVSKQIDMLPAGLEYRIKGKESFLRKIKSNYKPNGTRYEVKDILRYTLTSDAYNLAEKTNLSIDVFNEKGYTTTGIKNSWLDNNNPYKGINTNLTAPNGQTFEMQYHTLESFALKNGKMHELYESNEC